MLAFEYGINTGNRFLQFVDHDEEPEAFIAAQTKPDEPQKKSSTKDVKQSTKKVTSTTLSAAAAKTNKENLAGKSTSVDQRRQQSATVPAVFGDNKNQQARTDSARGTCWSRSRCSPARHNRFLSRRSRCIEKGWSAVRCGQPWPFSTLQQIRRTTGSIVEHRERLARPERRRLEQRSRSSQWPWPRWTETSELRRCSWPW